MKRFFAVLFVVALAFVAAPMAMAETFSPTSPTFVWSVGSSVYMLDSSTSCICGGDCVFKDLIMIQFCDPEDVKSCTFNKEVSAKMTKTPGLAVFNGRAGLQDGQPRFQFFDSCAKKWLDMSSDKVFPNEKKGSNRGRGIGVFPSSDGSDYRFLNFK